MNGCQFCDELNGEGLGLILNRIIHETENFVVFPTLGSFVEGYVLIVPKKHYLSFSQVPCSLYPELVELKQKTIYKITEKYTSPIVFEHGPVLEHPGGCCVEHAHLHFVPVNFNPANDFEYFTGQTLEGTQLSSFEDLMVYKDKPYFYIETSDRKMFIYPLDFTPERQCLRKIVALHLGVDCEWQYYRTELDRLCHTIKALK